MNKRHINYILGFLFTVSLAGIIACEGPAGQGEQGLEGEPGNANIMYSDWMNIEWSEEASNDVLKRMLLTESRITEDFLNEGGTVLMYLKIEDEGVLAYPLPLLVGDAGMGVFQWVFVLIDGGDGVRGISLALRSIDGTIPVPDFVWEGFQVRYILIPGGMNLAAKGVDLKKYEQVAEYFGIPD